MVVIVRYDSVEQILHGGKVVLEIETDSPSTIDETLRGLGYRGEYSSNTGCGGYKRDKPHNEWVNFDPGTSKPGPEGRVNAPVFSPFERKIIHFMRSYHLWNNCYSRVGDCPVGEEIALEFIKRGIRIAVNGRYVEYNDPTLGTDLVLVDVINL